MLARRCAPDYLVELRGFHVFSETYGWAPREGTWVVINGKRVSVNAAGYRGRGAGPAKGPGSHSRDRPGRFQRLGLEVAANDETFTHLLDARDNGMRPQTWRCRDMGPGQELLVLMNEGLRLEPDVVILAFCLANDFAERVLRVSLYDGVTPKPRFRLVGDRLVLDDSNLRQSAGSGPISGSATPLTCSIAWPRSAPAGSHPAIEWHARKHEALRTGSTSFG